MSARRKITVDGVEYLWKAWNSGFSVYKDGYKLFQMTDAEIPYNPQSDRGYSGNYVQQSIWPSQVAAEIRKRR